MSKSKRYMIYGAVVVTMAASIALLGFLGPIAVSLALEFMARRYGVKTK